MAWVMLHAVKHLGRVVLSHACHYDGRGPSARKGITMHKHLLSILGLAVLAVALSAPSARGERRSPCCRPGGDPRGMMASRDGHGLYAPRLPPSLPCHGGGCHREA